MYEIILIGSCVTRDVFDPHVVNTNFDSIKIRKYYSRTSIISLTSLPIYLDLAEISNLSPWECRFVHCDFNKEFFHYINTRDLSKAFLLLDFIDEGRDLLQIGEHFISISKEFEKSNLPSRFSGIKWLRMNPSTTKLWKERFRSFIEKVVHVFPLDRIIVHKAFWCESFIDGNAIERFSYIDAINSNNDILIEYYNFLELFYPKIQIIDLRYQGFLADKNHPWGIAPYHYEKNYYVMFLSLLKNILKTSKMEC